MTLRYDVVDVFTDRPYAGNPLAVVHGAAALTPGAMQAVAAEFHLSETVFALPPTTPDATHRVRIFTPARELPFAGHPSIGAAWVLAAAGAIPHGAVVQECGAGLLPVRVDATGAQVAGGAPEVGPDLPGEALAATVGLAAADLDPGLPAGVAAAGIPFAFLAVRPHAVGRARPVPAAVAGATADTTGLVVASVVRTGAVRTGAARTGAARAGVDHAAPGRTGTDDPGWHVHARVFCPQVGVPEDPATGSAAVALGVFLGARGVLGGAPDALSTTLHMDQGAEVGRPSRLEVTVRTLHGGVVETAVRGAVRRVARGELVAVP